MRLEPVDQRSARLNDVDPRASLAEVLCRIASAAASRVDDLLRLQLDPVRSVKRNLAIASSMQRALSRIGASMLKSREACGGTP